MPRIAIVLQRHGAGQRGNVAVVNHLQRHAELVADTQEHAADLVIAVGRNAAEERGNHRPVVHVDAGRAAADCVQPRQLALRQSQRSDDALVVVGRVGLLHRLPDDLVAPYRLPVEHGRHFEVGRAQVEADAAAVQVAAERLAGFLLRRRLVGRAGDDCERPLVDGLAHEVIVESPRPVRRVNAADVVSNARRPAHRDLPAAPGPEQELDQPLGVGQVGSGAPVVFGEGNGVKPRDGSIGAFQRDG
ncbi:MAG: hypothetical protein R2844_06125 [Caldilineales bacterium]